MSKPFLVVQLSDPHVGGDWGGADPVRMLGAAVAAVRRLPSPDAVIVTGDLTDGAAEAEYEQVKAALTPLDAPVFVLPGNHDARAALRRAFEVPGSDDEFVQYSADLGPLRLVVLDTTVPGQDGGGLDQGRLEWLDAELRAAPDAQTLIAMHHPPFLTGIPEMDAIGLPAADRGALAEVVARHPQIERVVAGHVHRTIAGWVGGRSVLVAPSTYLQLELDFEGHEIEMTPEPPGFAVHALIDGALVSHVQPVTD
jgi:3',5'-cyclic-AMP phosphodiesterase